MNNRLSICMTTYNRSEILDDVLYHIIGIIEKYDIAIYISDNNSTDQTSVILEKHKNNYKYLFYNINSINQGFDRNFEIVMNMSNSDYIWTMGDYSFIEYNSIEQLLNLLNNEEFDAIFLNNYTRVLNQPSKIYNDSKNIMKEIAWHVTILDSMVWNKKILGNSNFSRFYNTMFAYYGVMFEYLAKDNIKVYWDSNSYIKDAHPKKNSLYIKDTFEVWLKNWSNLILSLPVYYTYDIKLFLIREHGIKSGLLSIKRLLVLRKEKILNLKVLYKISTYLKMSLGEYIFRVFIISTIPSCILPVKLAKKFISNIKKD